MTKKEDAAAQKRHERAIDRIAKEMADEILRDPAFRAQMRVLLHRVFDRALKGKG